MYLKKLISKKKLELEKTVIGEFDNFINSGKERLVIGVTELSKEESDFYRAQVPKGWRTFEQGEHPYYPNNLLESKEQQVINQDKEYQVLCFVQQKTFGVAPYNESGVEIISRVHSHALLPATNPTSNWHYSSLKHFIPQTKLNEFVELINGSVSLSEFIKDVENAHKSYDEKTRTLLKEDKIQRDEALYKLDLRNESADECLFREMRIAISNPKYD